MKKPKTFFGKSLCKRQVLFHTKHATFLSLRSTKKEKKRKEIKEEQNDMKGKQWIHERVDKIREQKKALVFCTCDAPI